MKTDNNASLPGAETPAEAPPNFEKLPLELRPMSIQSVVKAIGSPDITYTKLQRAVRKGIVHYSQLQNGRKLVRICDVFKAMGIEGYREDDHEW